MSNQARFEIYPQMSDVPPATGMPHGEQMQPPPQEPTGEYGWRFQSANGQIVAISGEGYTRREDANRAIHEFLDELYAWNGEDPHPPILDADS